MLTTKQAIQAIKKHKGDVVVDAKIGVFGLWVAVAKNELILQIESQYGNVEGEWLIVNNLANNELSVEWVD